MKDGEFLRLALESREADQRNEFGVVGLPDAVGYWLALLSEEQLADWDQRIVEALRYEGDFAEDTLQGLIRDKMNSALSKEDVRAGVEWVNGRLRPTLKSASDWGRVWAQFYKAIANPHPWKLCDHCGHPYPVKRRGSGRFCSASCRVMAHRKEKGQ